MNFNAHLTGGILAGGALTIAATAISQTQGTPLLPLEQITIFGTTVGFALFPDLDTSSIPQRWFFRCIFVLLLGLGYYEYYQLATLLALVSITPLLDHHRSWTHHKLMPLLFPVAAILVYEGFLSHTQFWYSWSWENVLEYLHEYQWWMLACACGWYTHLILDIRLLKKLR